MTFSSSRWTGPSRFVVSLSSPMCRRGLASTRMLRQTKGCISVSVCPQDETISHHMINPRKDGHIVMFSLVFFALVSGVGFFRSASGGCSYGNSFGWCRLLTNVALPPCHDGLHRAPLKFGKTLTSRVERRWPWRTTVDGASGLLLQLRFVFFPLCMVLFQRGQAERAARPSSTEQAQGGKDKACRT